jgi:putative glutamine amidotransferase
LLLEIDALPVPLPNLPPDLIPEVIQSLKLDGVVLTGGNSLAFLDEHDSVSAPERDEFELALISYALQISLPVFGVCRGMQIINHYFKGNLKHAEGHINSRHKILACYEGIDLPEWVNSFHGWVIPEAKLGNSLKPIALDLEGNVEGFIHEKRRLAAIMWHPERVEGFDFRDLSLMKRILL